MRLFIYIRKKIDVTFLFELNWWNQSNQIMKFGWKTANQHNDFQYQRDIIQLIAITQRCNSAGKTFNSHMLIYPVLGADDIHCEKRQVATTTSTKWVTQRTVSILTSIQHVRNWPANFYSKCAVQTSS